MKIKNRKFPLCISTIININVEMYWDVEIQEWILTERGHKQIEQAKRKIKLCQRK